MPVFNSQASGAMPNPSGDPGDPKTFAPIGPKYFVPDGTATTIIPGTQGRPVDRCRIWGLMDNTARRRAVEAFLSREFYIFQSDLSGHIDYSSAAAEYIAHGIPATPAEYDPVAEQSLTGLLAAITRYCAGQAGASKSVMRKPSGAISASSAIPWFGGAAVGAIATYFICKKR